MSTTQCRCDFCINAQACAIACSADLLGRNPLLLSLNLASQIGSRIWRIHCWTILSHIAGIPSGLSFPLGFGISTLLTALGLYHWSFFLTISTNLVSGIFSISLIVSLSTPLVLLPELRLMLRYARRIFSSLSISCIRLLKIFLRPLSAYNISSVSCRS